MNSRWESLKSGVEPRLGKPTLIVKDAWRRWLPGGAELVGLRFVSQIGLQPPWNARKQLSIQEYLARPMQAHSHAGGQAGAKPKLYNPRHPERTLLYQTIAEHFETCFELASADSAHL